MSAAPQPIQGRESHADPDTQADVDFMILDYLACLAIDRSLAAIEKQNLQVEEEAAWHTQTVRAFQSMLAAMTQHMALLPCDLDIKLQILNVADHLRCYVPARPQRNRTGQIRLSRIGIEFMDLCSTATATVSETRWFDVGARIVTQAILEEKAEGKPPSPDLNQLCTWRPREPSRQSKWGIVRQEYVDKLPSSETVDTQSMEGGLRKLKDLVVCFLVDLMGTLDQPILLQLERGKLNDLSAVETQRLKERVGLA